MKFQPLLTGVLIVIGVFVLVLLSILGYLYYWKICLSRSVVCTLPPMRRMRMIWYWRRI